MKLLIILPLVLALFFFVPQTNDAFATFNIQTDGFNYKITGIADRHTYSHEIIQGNSTLMSGNWNISSANNDLSIPLPFQNKTGMYIWNWYADSTKTILVDSIKWGVLDLSISKKEVDTKISIILDTHLSKYKQGDLVVVFGKVTPLKWATPITLQLVNERNHLMGITQIIPQKDGSYSWSFIAEGYKWNHSQKISVRAHYLEELNITNFDFIKDKKIHKIKDQSQ